MTYTDKQLDMAAEAVLALAIAVREEGPDAVLALAQKAIDALGGDARSAVIAASCFIDVDRPVVRWWQPVARPDTVPPPRQLFGPRELQPCGTYAAYRRHLHAAQALDAACAEAGRAYYRGRYVNGLTAEGRATA